MSVLALLAQAGGVSPRGDIPQGVFIILSIVAGLTISIFAIVMGFKHAARERELQHAERMKALENGVPLDEMDEERRFRKGIMRLAFGIGVVVPAVAVTAAALAAANMPGPVASSSVFLIWTGAASVGVAGVASGAWLAQAAVSRLNPTTRRGASATSPYPRQYDAPKPAAVR